MAPVEALYTILQDEIQAFEKHIRSCQQAFDIHTLYNVLLLLLHEDDGVVEIHSLQQLEKLVESKDCNREDIVRITISEDKSDIASYISWFVSYVSYLSTLKEEFDAKVVFPLCENLYVNDDSLDGLPLGFLKGCRPHATVSIARTARQLFALRRKWALLLKKDSICEQAFHPQSCLDLQGFAYIHPFVKILRLVPDLFHKSLAAAELTKQWVKYHASRHSSHPEHSHPVLIRRCDDIRVMKGSLAHPWHGASLCQSELSLNHHDCMKTSQPSKADNNKNNMDMYKTTIIQERNQLQETYGELLSLLWREERSWTLEGEIQEVNQRISDLYLQQEAKESELEALEQQLKKGNWNVSRAQRQRNLCELNTLQRQLRLEKYRKNILQGDWLLELEVRPILIRPIYTLQERCQKLMRFLQAEEDIQHDLLPADRIDSHASYNSVGLNILSSCP
ncbi:uncharacterized protein LOC117675237 isoform X1 [Pantherophis guttatus]|uniref:Uncharacterized protein LOC117675237 isoform X1 n=1 Tax=Pantherophis guttatus TaxID=94885 RepID=A0A6P9D1T5_PANGU|nr:uncharacterized protein LOC117675237 isoform X1 [Pantherophis guttatus]